MLLQDFADVEESPDPEMSGEQRRRNGRFLLLVSGVGGLAIAVIAAVSVVVVGHYLDDTSSLDATMSTKYQRVFRDCLDNGRDRSSCASRAQQSCITDPGWFADKRSDEALLVEISDVCRFGPDRTG